MEYKFMKCYSTKNNFNIQFYYFQLLHSFISSGQKCASTLVSYINQHITTRVFCGFYVLNAIYDWQLVHDTKELLLKVLPKPIISLLKHFLEKNRGCGRGCLCSATIPQKVPTPPLKLQRLGYLLPKADRASFDRRTVKGPLLITAILSPALPSLLQGITGVMLGGSH